MLKKLFILHRTKSN